MQWTLLVTLLSSVAAIGALIAAVHVMQQTKKPADSDSFGLNTPLSSSQLVSQTSREALREYATRLIGEGQYADGLAILFGLWEAAKWDTRLLAECFAAVSTLCLEGPVDLGAQWLSESEAALFAWLQQPAPDIPSSHPELRQLLNDTGDMLRRRIAGERQAAFSKTVASLEQLTASLDERVTVEYLKQAASRAEALSSGWSQPTPDELQRWTMAYREFQDALSSRQEAIRQTEQLHEQQRINLESERALEETLREMDLFIKQVGTCKSRQELQDVSDRCVPVIGGLAEGLTEAHQLQVQLKMKHFEVATHDAAERIRREALRRYNAQAQTDMSKFLSRLDKVKAKDDFHMGELVGSFASIDASLLEPAQHRYYDYTISQALQKLAKSPNLSGFMLYLAETEKRPLEE